MKKFIYISAILMLIISSCDKNNVGDCFKSTGPMMVQERSITNFHTVLLKDNVNLILEYSDSSKLKVEAGSNLLNNIVTDINDSILTISNLNSCNWVRNYNSPINVYLDISLVDTIYYRSSADVICIDTVVKDIFQLDVFEGSGIISLLLNTKNLIVNMHTGSADIMLDGITTNSYLFQNGFGRIDGSNCRSSSVYARNWSSNNMYLYPENYLSVEIKNIGDVYYHGNPQIDATLTSTGKLIPY